MKKLFNIVEFNLSQSDKDIYSDDANEVLSAIPTATGKEMLVTHTLADLSTASISDLLVKNEEWVILLGDTHFESNHFLMELIAKLTKVASKLHLLNVNSKGRLYTLLVDNSESKGHPLDELLYKHGIADSVKLMGEALFSKTAPRRGDTDILEALMLFCEARLEACGAGKSTHTIQADPNEDVSKLIKAVTGELVKLNRNLNRDETNESHRDRERTRRPSVRQVFGTRTRDDRDERDLPRWGCGCQEEISIQRARLDIEDAINQLTVSGEDTVEGLYSRIQKDIANLSLISAALFNSNKLDDREIESLYRKLGDIDDTIMRITIDLLESTSGRGGRGYAERWTARR